MDEFRIRKGKRDAMKAVVFDHVLHYIEDYPRPELKPQWAEIRVRSAGICKTDIEIIKGYLGFKGVPGHEFVGVVERSSEAVWIGRRVVGEINAACGACDWCAVGLGRHCPNRTTLGILNHDGCMAQYCVLPVSNLIEVPAEISDDRAVLIEPLSAACEILEQLTFSGRERVIVLGDGRLGILCAWALSTVLSNVTLVGHHREKLAIARWRGINTTESLTGIPPGADIVVEATGSGLGIADAMSVCRPRGTIVLKSTVAAQENINLAPVVINEQTILGSRCGRFSDGLKMMQDFPDMPLDRLITARYPLQQVTAAFHRAQQGNALKVLFDIERS